MNKSNINEQSAETKADRNSTVQNQQVSQPNANANVGSRFQKGDRIIWDSHFGYEIGHFVSVCPYHEAKYIVDLWSGVVAGEVAHWQNEIHEYSEELVAELSNRYGRTLKFIGLP